MSKDSDALLEKWETVYKRGLLSFWILLLLQRREMYAYEMQDEIRRMSGGSVAPDENSIYRALRRFAREGLVSSERLPSDVGPERRYFSLTANGRELLARFIRRNLLAFRQTEVRGLMDEIVDGHRSDL